MEAINTAWDFFQNELLGMHWLNRLIRFFVNACGLFKTNLIVGSVQFFIHDSLRRIDFDYFVYSKLLPAGEDKKDTRKISRDMGKYPCCPAWNGNSVLLLLVHPFVYRVYKCGVAAWSNIFFSDFVSDG